MTEREYRTIEEAFDSAEQDDTPFLVATEDELVVVGDANKTEIDPHDFKIQFRLPPEKPGEKERVVDKEYKGVYIKPRQRTRLVKALTAIKPFFKKVEENGGLMSLSPEEVAVLLMQSDEEMFDLMYDLVGAALGIDPALVDYMEPLSVLDATANIIHAFSDAANESDFFSGRSSARRSRKGKV